MNKFNVKQLAIAITATMPLRDAAGEILSFPKLDGEGKPVFGSDGQVMIEPSITFHSPGTAKFQEAKHAAEERATNRAFTRMQGRGSEKQSAKSKLSERASFMAAVTKSFNNFDYGDDSLAGRELFLRIYSDPELGHILEDAEKFVADRGNFKNDSVTSSAPMSATVPG